MTIVALVDVPGVLWVLTDEVEEGGDADGLADEEVDCVELKA